MSAPDAHNIPRCLGATTGRLARPVQPMEVAAARPPVKQVVRAESVGLLNLAAAEIAIEGRFRTDVPEMEGPFGEYGGYAGPRDYQLIFEVSAITHRRSPILQAFIREIRPAVPCGPCTKNRSTPRNASCASASDRNLTP